MPPPLVSAVVRLRVTPDDPAAVVGPRPRGSRRPHSDAQVAAVRRLIEQTPLTYGEIAAKTGVGPRQHLPLDARPRLAAPPVRPARHRHDPAPARRAKAQAAAARRAAAKTCRALRAQAGGDAGRRSRQAGAGA